MVQMELINSHTIIHRSNVYIFGSHTRIASLWHTLILLNHEYNLFHYYFTVLYIVFQYVFGFFFFSVCLHFILLPDRFVDGYVLILFFISFSFSNPNRLNRFFSFTFLFGFCCCIAHGMSFFRAIFFEFACCIAVCRCRHRGIVCVSVFLCTAIRFMTVFDS